MQEPDYRKLVIVGDVGSGKTQLISTLSEIDTINTDVTSSIDIGKDTTTVGIDYGRIHLNGNLALGLYGVPGQTRYSFIWETVKPGTWGMILLLHAEQEFDPLSFQRWLQFFDVSANSLPLLVAISHSDQVSDEDYQRLQRAINDHQQQNDLCLPVLPLNCRDPHQALSLLTVINTLAN
ncbi:GTP-binding protein [Bacterioplanoides pacificum]|uniref:ATP/GTP-binding protein n=1 Tax=Bacterioplanoides pacificum TaxID=1171596 RepID=A0ABV7VPM4_9GAMM